MNDNYVEFKEIPDGTPQEMAQFYADTINTAYHENRTGISKLYKELMPVRLIQDYRLEFKGKHFIYLLWGTTRLVSKEDFFENGDAFGNKNEV